MVLYNIGFELLEILIIIKYTIFYTISIYDKPKVIFYEGKVEQESGYIIIYSVDHKLGHERQFLNNCLTGRQFNL